MPMMGILKSQPAVTEICVGNVNPRRFAAESGGYENLFQGFNDAMAQHHH